MSSTETDRNELEPAEYDSDSVTGIVFDDSVDAVSSAVGTAAMTVVLLVETTLGASTSVRSRRS
jgi:endoglucanase Acf2